LSAVLVVGQASSKAGHMVAAMVVVEQASSKAGHMVAVLDSTSGNYGGGGQHIWW